MMTNPSSLRNFCSNMDSVGIFSPPEYRPVFHLFPWQSSPPLWFLSILILIIPLTPPTCEFDKASGERAVLLCHTRVAERMWAHRSLCAAGVFSGLVTFIAAAFVVITHAA